LQFDLVTDLLLPAVLFKICGVCRSVNQPTFSVGLEAAKPTNIFFSSKLTEPRANQQGKRVRIFRKYKVLLFVQNTKLLMP
jgi:hypothetical protein